MKETAHRSFLLEKTTYEEYNIGKSSERKSLGQKIKNYAFFYKKKSQAKKTNQTFFIKEFNHLWNAYNALMGWKSGMAAEDKCLLATLYL